MKLKLLYESILQESFKDLERLLSDEFGDRIGDVYLDLIRKARDRNALPPMYNDISNLIRLLRRDPVGFREEMNDIKIEMDRRDQKRREEQQRRVDDTFHYRSEDLIIVEPGSHESSCKYGRGTKWCTTMSDVPDHFIEYTSNGGRLFYVLTDMDKFAVWVSNQGTVNVYDSGDDAVSRRVLRDSMESQYEEYELQDMIDNINDPILSDVMRRILRM